MSFVIRAEHPVASFDAWRARFDSDPLEREASGVLRYRVMRGTADAQYALIDLEFAERADADAFLARLEELWKGVDVMHDPRAQIAEIVDRGEY